MLVLGVAILKKTTPLSQGVSNVPPTCEIDVSASFDGGLASSLELPLIQLCREPGLS